MKWKIKNKKWLLVVIMVVLIFVIYNIFWLSWRNLRYNRYADNLETFSKYYSYILTAEDGYLYNAKFPEYLSFTGNLCVATPDGKIGLLLWPNIFKGYQYGVQIEEDGEIYSIELDENLNAKDQNFNDLVNKYKNTIQLLREKATNMWD